MTDGEQKPKHVLVVNDTEEIIELFRDIIEGMGHRMSGTSYAPEELTEIQQAEPDLVIVDIVIKGEKLGWQLVQKMRMSPDTADLPIIVCTAATDDVREQEGWLTANAVKVVLKPFRVEELERAVTKALELPGLVTQEGPAGGGH